MGRSSAIDMAEYATLEAGIHYQLRANFYPPHPVEMVEVAIRAVRKFNKGLWDTKVKSPYPHKVHGKLIPVMAIIESFKLDPWLDIDMIEEYNYEKGNL